MLIRCGGVVVVGGGRCGRGGGVCCGGGGRVCCASPVGRRPVFCPSSVRAVGGSSVCLFVPCVVVGFVARPPPVGRRRPVVCGVRCRVCLFSFAFGGFAGVLFVVPCYTVSVVLVWWFWFLFFLLGVLVVLRSSRVSRAVVGSVLLLPGFSLAPARAASGAVVRGAFVPVAGSVLFVPSPVRVLRSGFVVPFALAVVFRSVVGAWGFRPVPSVLALRRRLCGVVLSPALVRCP